MPWEDVGQEQPGWETVSPDQSGWEEVSPKKKGLSLPKIGAGIVRAITESVPVQVASKVAAGFKGKGVGDIPGSAIETINTLPQDFKTAQKAGGRAAYEFATFIPSMAVEFVKDPIETINNKPVETAMLFTAIGGAAGLKLRAKKAKGEPITSQEVVAAIKESKNIPPEVIAEVEKIAPPEPVGPKIKTTTPKPPEKATKADVRKAKVLADIEKGEADLAKAMGEPVNPPAKTVRGTYYFKTAGEAEAWAKNNGWPTDRIISYEKGYAVQSGKSGNYAGPNQTPKAFGEEAPAQEPKAGEPVRPLSITSNQMGMGLTDFEMAQASGDVFGIVPQGFQMKSPVSPEVAKIRDIIKKTPGPLENMASAVKGVVTKPSKVVNKAAFELVDRYDPFRRWENRVVKSLQKHDAAGELTPGSLAEKVAKGGIPIDESAYNILQLRGGAGGFAELAYHDLQRVFNRVGDMPKEFTDYMVALRLMERDGRGISNPGGLKTADAMAAYNKIMDALPPEKQAKFKTAAQQFTYWANMNIIKRMVDSDMLSGKDAVKIMDANHHPLPFQKFTSKEDIVKFLNDVSFDKMKDGEPYVNVVGKKIFEMEGMDKHAKISNPWEAVLERLGAVIGVAERNKALVEFVKKSQLSPETRKYVRRIKGDTQLPPSIGTFSVVFDGKAQKWTAPIDIIESIKTLQSKDVSFITGLMGKTKGAFVMGTTGLNIPFALVKNPIRDIWTASITSKYGFGPGAYLSGLTNALASNFGFPTRLYNDYIRAHANYGQFLNRAPKLKARDLFLDKPNVFGPMAGISEKLPGVMNKAYELSRSVINPINLVKGISKSIEMAPRMAVFKKAMAGVAKENPTWTKTQVDMKSALLARRSTVDFHRAGDFVKTVNYFVPFLNARVQSVMITLDSFFSKSGARAGKSSLFGIKGDPRAIAMARAATFVVTPALAAYFYNRLYHSKEYDSVPADTKDRYIVIMTGNSSADPDTGQVKPEAILIPKTDAHQMIWNPLETFLEWSWQKQPQDISKVAMNFFSNLSPVQFEKEGEFSLSRSIAGMTPPALQAPLSIATNKDMYWDRPLVPQRLENVAPSEQYTSYTPELYKTIGEKINVSPIKTQKVAESLLGTVARTPTPGSISKGLKETVVRRVGKETSTGVYDIDKAATSGYATARIRAERAAKEGDKETAKAIMKAWNTDVLKHVKDMAKELGVSPFYIKRQSWYKTVSFSLDDMKAAIKRGTTKPQSAIKKRLGIK